MTLNIKILLTILIYYFLKTSADLKENTPFLSFMIKNNRSILINL